MITFETARNGQLILKKDGRFLGSSFDPAKEARLWAERAVQGGHPEEGLIVLGLGSGYHVAELIALTPKPVLVIDSDQAIADGVKEIVPSIPAAQILIESDWTRLIERTRFRDAVTRPYRVVTFGPSAQIDSEYFRAVEHLLIARDRAFFLLQLKIRPELCAQLDPEAILALSDELVSIKSMAKMFSKSSVHSRERRLWRALEELIA